VQTTIDANIFDLVTAASSFNQATQNSLAFQLLLTNNTRNITQPLQQLFQIRQSGLFESIPKKQVYGAYFSTLFNNFITSQLNYGLLELGIGLGLVALFVGVILPLSLSLLTTIDQTIMLFGFMSRLEVEREIENCNSFL
jgi:hypothetical protein